MTFPRQYARTRRFTLGVPGRFTVSPDGTRVVFCRSRNGSDPVGCLWTYDVAGRSERLLVDPSALGDPAAPVPREERIRRERARERGTGITGYATDAAVESAVFSLSGNLWRVDLRSGAVTAVPVAGAAIDPRLSGDGTAIAYVSGGALRVGDGDGDRALAEPEAPLVGYGLPEHVAAESMHRMRGYWWAPDGRRLVVARVDVSPVQVWYLADPAEPTAPPTALRYPAAGTANADVTLWIVGLDGTRVGIDWDRREFEYVTAVRWDAFGLLVVVQSRAQDRMRILDVDPDTGRTRVLREDVHNQDLLYLGTGPHRRRCPAVDRRHRRHAAPRGGRRNRYPARAAGARGTRRRRRHGAVPRLRRPGADTAVDVVAPRGTVRVSDEAGVHDGRRAGGGPRSSRARVWRTPVPG